MLKDDCMCHPEYICWLKLNWTVRKASLTSISENYVALQDMVPQQSNDSEMHARIGSGAK